MKLINRFLCALLSIFILCSFSLSNSVQASDLETWNPEYIPIEEDDLNLDNSCSGEVPEVPATDPIKPDGPLQPTNPTKPGIPLDPVKPPVVSYSITPNTINEEIQLEDGCDYQEVYIDFVENNDVIPYDPAADGYVDVVYDDINFGISPQALPFIIPLVAPHVIRYGGKLVVRQYLKSTTKNLVIRNGHLAGKLHPVSKVRFSALGFPMFTEKFAMTLPLRLIKSSNSTQFSQANKALKAAIGSSSTIRNKFSTSQLTDIRNGKTPRGLTWHHHENRGRMELVDTELHKLTGHTGGKAIWGSY